MNLFLRGKYYFIFLWILFIFSFHYCKKVESSQEKDKKSSKLQKMGYALSNQITQNQYFGKNRLYWQKNLSHYDIISSTGFCLNSKGKIENSPISTNFIKDLKLSHTQFHPLVNFCNTNAGYEILKKKKINQKAVFSIIKLARKEYISGIHIDFEYISPQYSNNLVQFLQNIAIPIRNQNKTISIALFPKIRFPEKYHKFHDIEKIEKWVDFVVIMAYDYHSVHTTPGPITSYRWAEDNILFFQKYYKNQKIFLGIPAYGYWWNHYSKKVKVLTSKNLLTYKKNKKINRHISGCLYLENHNGSGFISDKITRKNLIKLAERYHLHGTAMWRIGFEENLIE